MKSLLRKSERAAIKTKYGNEVIYWALTVPAGTFCFENTKFKFFPEDVFYASMCMIDRAKENALLADFHVGHCWNSVYEIFMPDNADEATLQEIRDATNLVVYCIAVCYSVVGNSFYSKLTAVLLSQLASHHANMNRMFEVFQAHIQKLSEEAVRTAMKEYLDNDDFWARDIDVLIEQNAEKAEPREEKLHQAITELLPFINKKRQWFPVVKTLMWKGYVVEGDFAGAASMIQRLFPEGLNPNIDSADLSKLNVQSFSKKLDKWNVMDAPITQNNAFSQYVHIAQKAIELIPEKS